jgi:MFS transporter, DHA2 family, multidrug resistance protein
MGFALITTTSVGAGLGVIVTGSVIFAAGLAPVATLATDLIVGTAPPERAGAASALSETGAEFGGAFGIAILGSIGTAVYRTQLADMVPAGTPAHAAEAARDTLGGAVAAAQHLPPQVGEPLAEAARTAFTQGLRVAAAIASVIAAGMAALVVALLRRVRVSTNTQPEEGGAFASSAIAAMKSARTDEGSR